MHVTLFSSKNYDRQFFTAANGQHGHTLKFLSPHLDQHTAMLATGSDVVCAFVNDTLSAPVLDTLASLGVRHVALRCAGYNNVDLEAAGRNGILVSRVPAYSPHAVAEHTVALLLDLNRKVHRAHTRVREGNFSLDGLLGFDLHGRTAGIIGTGRIGINVIRILRGFGCEVLAYDPHPQAECRDLGARYVSLEELFAASDIISIHCPLTPESHHLINAAALEQMKPGVMLINTSRGAVVDSKALVAGLKSGKIGYLGLDVYEEEGDLFFEDLSDTVIQDDVFARLTTFPNVIITGHQGFFTREALGNIAETTLSNIDEFATRGECTNAVPISPPR